MSDALSLTPLETAELEITLRRSPLNTLRADFRLNIPGDEADNRYPDCEFALNLAQLQSALDDVDQQGLALSHMLFAEPRAREALTTARAKASAKGSPLRIRLSCGLEESDLHRLPWETLRDPSDPRRRLFHDQTVYFSRYLSSHDNRTLKLRPRTELRAVAMVANPRGLNAYRLASIPVESELSRIRRALGRIPLTVVGRDAQPSSPGPATLDRLMETLQEGYDLLYLVCHGRFDGNNAWLYLENEQGEVSPVEAQALVERLSQLEKRPWLVVLASCQSGGEEDGILSDAPVLRALGPQLVDRGIPAVLAMQGNVQLKTVERFMPTFFKALADEGQLDRAVAVARSGIPDPTAAWRPVLFMRLKNGRIWEPARFLGSDKPQETLWKELLIPIREGRVVPILGPRLLHPIVGSQTAQKLAKAEGFPFARDADDLPRVAAYISVTRSRKATLDLYKAQLHQDLLQRHAGMLSHEGQPSEDLNGLMKRVGERLREEEPYDPYKVLASLQASVYLTVNYDMLLEHALVAHRGESRGENRDEKPKKPQQVVTRWRARDKPEEREAQPFERPTPEKPLVYHYFGVFGKKSPIEGIVLTEDDYFDYLIKCEKEGLIPTEVDSALVSNSLLILSFRLTDWHFRLLFRLMMRLEGRELTRMRNLSHVAVQLDADLPSESDLKSAREYLQKYFGKEANISIYWGSAGEFLKTLAEKLAAAGPLQPITGEDDDEF